MTAAPLLIAAAALYQLQLRYPALALALLAVTMIVARLRLDRLAHRD